MIVLYRKEIGLFFSNLSGFLSIGLFLLLMGLLLFLFPETSLLDFGYATLDKFFELAPWVLLLLVPAVTMRSFSDEFKSNTWELLRTKPFSLGQIIVAKYGACFTIVFLALLPTTLYIYTIQALSITGSIDYAAILGSYIALLLLSAVFVSVGLLASASSSNAIISFLMAAFLCFLLLNGFQAIASLNSFRGGGDYWISQLGILDHYLNMSRGVLAIADLAYFLIVTILFLLLTGYKLLRR